MQSVTLGHQRSNSESWLTSPSPGPQPGGPAQSSLPWVTDPSTPLRPAATTFLILSSHPQFLQDEEPRSPARASLSSPKLQRNSNPNASLRAPQDLSEPNDAHLTPHILPGTPSQAPPHSQSRPARGTSPVLESKAGDANFSADRLSVETGWHLSLCEAHAQEAALWAVMTSGGERRQDP